MSNKSCSSPVWDSCCGRPAPTSRSAAAMSLQRGENPRKSRSAARLSAFFRFPCFRAYCSSPVGPLASSESGGRELHPSFPTDSRQAQSLLLHNLLVGSKRKMQLGIANSSSGFRFQWSHLGTHKARNPPTRERALVDAEWGKGHCLSTSPANCLQSTQLWSWSKGSQRMRIPSSETGCQNASRPRQPLCSTRKTSSIDLWPIALRRAQFQQCGTGEGIAVPPAVARPRPHASRGAVLPGMDSSTL